MRKTVIIIRNFSYVKSGYKRTIKVSKEAFVLKILD